MVGDILVSYDVAASEAREAMTRLAVGTPADAVGRGRKSWRGGGRSWNGRGRAGKSRHSGRINEGLGRSPGSEDDTSMWRSDVKSRVCQMVFEGLVSDIRSFHHEIHSQAQFGIVLVKHAVARAPAAIAHGSEGSCGNSTG